MKPIGMAGLQAGSKIVDRLIDIGGDSLNEALWGDYYRLQIAAMVAIDNMVKQEARK